VLTVMLLLQVLQLLISVQASDNNEDLGHKDKAEAKDLTDKDYNNKEKDMPSILEDKDRGQGKQHWFKLTANCPIHHTMQ
jgi:hypothetical protein